MDENENHVIKHRVHFPLTIKPKKNPKKNNIDVLFLMTNCFKSGVKFAIGLLAHCQKPVPPMQTVNGRQEQQQSYESPKCCILKKILFVSKNRFGSFY